MKKKSDRGVAGVSQSPRLLRGLPPNPMTHGVAATGGALSAISSNYIPKGADWAGGLPRGRGASAAPAPLAAAGGGLGVPRGVPCSSRRVADDRTAFDVPGPGRRLIAREREVKSDQTRAPSGRGQGGGCWVLIKRRAKEPACVCVVFCSNRMRPYILIK